MIDTSAQADRLKAHDELATRIATAEKELVSAKALIASFENEEYKAINADLGKLNKELQGLRNWRSRLEALIRELRLLRGKQSFPPSENPNAYEVEFFALLKSIDEISAPIQGRANLAAAAAREAELAEAVTGLKQKLETFLKGRGLSQENLADVGKANERVAQIEQELPAQKAKEAELAAQIAAFTARQDLTAKRAATVTALLEPLNKTLAQLGKEVRAIELRYEFDEAQFEQAMTKHIQERLGANAPRIDHLASMLEDVDFANLTTRENFVSKLPEKQATAKQLRDYFSIPLNFALLKVEAQKKLMDFGAFGRIRVSYDGKPVESSSFGKSSFVFAGVVPRLRECGGWEILSLRPGRRPWASLASALQCDVTALTTKPAGLVTELRRRSSGRLLLFIDQFEELVTLGDEDDRLSFLRAVALAASADEPWRVMVTVRSDFLGQFAAVPELTSALQSVLVLRPLGRAALEAAVLGPLARVGHAPDEPSLPAQIAAELMGQPAALPLLQFVCQALWDRRDAQRKVVLRREYDAMGGAVGALATHAERLVSELLPAERKLTRALMIRLVNPDGTRRPRTRDELLLGLAPEASASLDRLLSQRLLVTTRHENTGEPLLELAHESLVSTWPQLTRWLAETQESRTLLQEIEQAALFWDKRGRRDDETWVNEALLDVTRRVQKWNVSLTSTPRDFIEAGKARQARLLRRRRLLVMTAFSIITLFALSASAAAWEFREKERIAIAQQELIRLAAGDVGRFALVLEPFDWDSKRLERTVVSAATLPDLNWRLYEASRTSPPVRGKELEAGRVKRSERHVDAQGRLSEIVEMGRNPVFFEFTGRGADCGSSSLYVQALPGYADRQMPPAEIHLPVPTCGATREGVARFATPDGGTFGLDRTEVPSELWAIYGDLLPLTGDQRTTVPPSFAQGGRRGLPVVGIDAAVAARACVFLGRRLPKVEEWMQAAKSHPQRQSRRVDGCIANLGGVADGSEWMAPVGSCNGDATDEGVVDLLGNVSEWTNDDEIGEGSNTKIAGLRRVVGANWDFPPGSPPTELSYINARPVTQMDYALGVRCASE